MDGKTYEDGIREGRIRGIEETIQHHGGKIQHLERRITAQERISYAVLGALALMQILPALQGVLK